MISVTIGGNGLKGIDPLLVDKAIRSTQRRIGERVKTYWAREIGNVLALPIGEIKSHIDLRVHAHRSEVAVGSEKGIKLGRFNPKQDSVGTSVLVRKDKGRYKIRHAFIWNAQVWQRKSRKRTPIELLYSTDVEDVARDTQPIIQRLAIREYDKELNRNLRFFLGK